MSVSLRNPFRILCSAGCIFLSACALGPTVQPQINYMAVTGRYDRALSVLERHKKDYGERNHLLYLLDKGLVLHYAGEYRESIKAFEEAKKEYDKLLTASLSKEALSWAWNDYVLPYRGEDFERVLINIFQALNYAALKDWEEALVEARDVDSKLRAINLQYDPDQRNIYKEDAFARFLMGILYEASGGRDLDDADISYRKALEIYETDYQEHFGVTTPELLKEKLKDHGRGEAEIYLLAYQGFAPTKIDANFIVPVEGQLYKFAFLRYKERYRPKAENVFTARREGATNTDTVEPVQNINALAKKTLENRRLRLTAKTLVRMAGKGLLVKEQTDRVGDSYGDTAGGVAKVAGNLIYLYSEQADLRSWQTLPAQIGMARVVVEPGAYELYFNETPVGEIRVRAGEKAFVFHRTLK